MTIKLHLTGPDPRGVLPAAAAFLQEIGGGAPVLLEPEQRASGRRDPATALAVASLVLSLPGAVVATLQIKERLDRRRLAKSVETLRAQLAEAGCDGTLEAEAGGSIDLVRDPTDRIVDFFVRDPLA